MINVDISWMSKEAQDEFGQGVEAFAWAVRSGILSGYETGEGHMRAAGQLMIQRPAPTLDADDTSAAE